MIAFLAIAVTVATATGLVVLVLVVAAVRREDRTPHLPVEAPGPVTALARRVLGLHVRRTHADVTDLRHGMTARRH